MKYILILLILVGSMSVLTGNVALADTTPSADNTAQAASTALAEAGLDNPLGTDDVRVLIGRVIKAILGISGALALVMFIWGGLIWMTSQGEKDRIQKGQKTLSWAVIGLAILFVSYAAVNWVILALQQSTG